MGNYVSAFNSNNIFIADGREVGEKINEHSESEDK